MAENKLKTYKGNRHCGAFKFDITAPEIKEATVCNCNCCFAKGYFWIFLPAKNFKVISGDGSLVGYEFGKKTMTHKFCTIWGTSVMVEPQTEELKTNCSLDVSGALPT